jgi:ankyrin repeat protein
MLEDTEAIDLLLEFGAEINVKDAKGGTPLHLAAEM